MFKRHLRRKSCSKENHLKHFWWIIAGHFFLSMATKRQPFPRVTLAEVTFSLFLSKIQPTVYIKNANSPRGARQLGWASCLSSAGKITLASGTTFLHINALARLPGIALGVVSVTRCLDFGFKAEIRSKEEKIHSAKHTVIGWPRETQRKRNICTFGYSIKVMNNRCRVNFDSAYRNHVFMYKRSIKLSLGEGCPGYPRPNDWVFLGYFFEVR